MFNRIKIFVFSTVMLLLFSTSCTKKVTLDNALNQLRCKALLATNFETLEEFKEVVSINYSKEIDTKDSSVPRRTEVTLHYSQNGFNIYSILKSGTSQKDISDARDGNLWDQINLLFDSPYAIQNRRELSKIYMLARRRPLFFKEGDVAFYDLAEASLANIKTKSQAFKNPKNRSEKGYINTFNHITAQVLITAIYSEEIADFIADVHERKAMPELTHGLFTQKQLQDTINYPVDNYVDMVNNELGQELGKILKLKYHISSQSEWTPQLLSDFLNDIQSYYSWSFDIGFKAFKPEDDLIKRYSDKINAVLAGKKFYIL